MSIYKKTSLIECSVEELFDFHLDMNNLKAITPNNIKVTLLNEGVIPKEGAVLRIKSVKNFIPTLWEVKIEKIDAPNLLVDIAMKSPFKSWRHSHVFSKVDEKTSKLEDIVEYTLPFGFLNSLLDLYIKFELNSMFDYRHEVTKKLLKLD